MALETYILTQNTKAPYVVATGNGRNPQAIKFKQFRRGEIIKGELKHANNQPAFVLVQGTLVVPLSVLRKVVTKEINSGADGETDEKKKTPVTVKSVATKAGYIDGVLVGVIAGVAFAYLAEKQGWIVAPAEGGNKNKMYGAAIGAVLGLYAVYKIKQMPPKPVKKED